jgi:hypothetical protein
MNTEGSGIELSIVDKLVSLLNGIIWLNLSQTAEIMKPVLVVEDDKTSYMLIREFLKPLGLDLHHVTDGAEAINYIKLNPEIRLILMDLKLPAVDGYEATKIIKQINPKIIIIAQTAYAMPGDREKAISAGCDDYLTKPIDHKKLQELVSKYL